MFMNTEDDAAVGAVTEKLDKLNGAIALLKLKVNQLQAASMSSRPSTAAK